MGISEKSKDVSVILDYRKRINQAVKFMQDNAFRQLSINEIAETANFSPFHFHRIFTAFTGETIFQYLTSVRMNKAVEMLLSGHRTSEIAIIAGYQTTAAFNKVFKKTFGCSPTSYKLSITDKISVLTEGPTTLKSEVQPVIVELSDMNLLYVRRYGRNYGQRTKAADEAFYKLYDWLGAHFENPRSLTRLGIIHDLDEVFADKCKFDACVVIDDPARFALTGEVKAGVIKAGTWASFLHKGPYDTLWQTWNWIYRNWFPSSGLALRDEVPFEIYHNSPFFTEQHELLTDIYIPISL